MQVPTPQREYRLGPGVPLSVAALPGGLSLARASQIERHPERARAGELERLRKGVDRAAAAGGEGDGTDPERRP